jgi:serpin B
VRARRGRRAIAAALVVAAAAIAASPGAGSASPSHFPSPTAAADAANAFALALLPKLNPGSNLVYSPYSIATALAMAGAGARGTTAAQIATTLGAPSTTAELADARTLRHAIAAATERGSGAPTLDVANALWTQRGLRVRPPFVTTLATDFGAPPFEADFATAPQAARAAINGWVSTHTNRIIPTVLPDGSITPATRFVLANAIYLKARWATPFDPAATHPMPFTTASGRRVTVPFMSATGVSYPYADGAGYRAVDLPYRSSSLSMLAVLPVGGPLTKLEHDLTARSLAAIIRSLHERPVDLQLPKLHLRTQAALNAPLEALGMTAAFGPRADFAGITPDAQLHIGLVEHAADLRLDEQGTVAAGATVVVGPTAIAGPAVTLDLDRPFLLLLREDRSGAVLFLARVTDPGS